MQVRPRLSCCNLPFPTIVLGVRFFETFSPSIAVTHKKILQRLSTLLLPSHIQQDELAQRFRNEKYILRMSRSGFNLLIGWLTEGFGGESLGAGEGFSGERSKRGRAAVMKVVNNHLQFDGQLHSSLMNFVLDTDIDLVTPSSTTAVPDDAWEERTGLLSSLIPTDAKKTSLSDPVAFNSSAGELKLGPPPVDESLQTEAERLLRDDMQEDGDIRPTTPEGLSRPLPSDMPPLPPSFRTLDVKREVEKVRDARKKIRLDPTVLTMDKDANSPEAAAARARALPSICAYTLYDVGDGYVGRQT